MKEPTLSLLSRGCAQVVKTEVHNDQGKLEVYFEPQDYFNWKSQQDYIRLPRIVNRRDLLNPECYVPEPAPPKTYSTRKGPLILYSEDLALSSWQPGGPGRKRKGLHGHGRYGRDMELQLHTLRDLTGAILAYGNKQEGQHEVQPFLHFLSEEPGDRQMRPGYSAKRYLACLSQTWDPNTMHKFGDTGSIRDPFSYPENPGNCSYQYDLSTAPRPYKALPGCLPTLETVHEGYPCWQDSGGLPKPGQTKPLPKSRRNKGMLLEEQKTENLQKRREIPGPRIGMSPVPESEAEPANQEERAYNANENQDSQAKVSEWNPVSQKLYKDSQASLRQASIDSSWLHSERSHATYYGGTLVGGRKSTSTKPGRSEQKERKETTLRDSCSAEIHFPPVPSGMLFGLGPIKETADETNPLKESGPEIMNLPSLVEAAGAHRPPRKKQQEPELPKELLILPLLLQRSDDQRIHFNPGVLDHENDSRTEPADPSRNYEKEMEARAEGPAAEKAARTALFPVLRPKEIGLEWSGMGTTENMDTEVSHDHAEESLASLAGGPTVGLLPPIVGRKGPGHQSSMACFKANSKDSKDIPTGVIRGSLPEELRECYKGSSVGSLIMGPDGQIIRLSLLGPITDYGAGLHLDDITQNGGFGTLGPAVSMEQPWTIFLQQDGGVPGFGENAMDSDTDPNLAHLNPTHMGLNSKNNLMNRGPKKTGFKSDAGSSDSELDSSLEQGGRHEAGHLDADKSKSKASKRAQRRGALPDSEAEEYQRHLQGTSTTAGDSAHVWGRGAESDEGLASLRQTGASSTRPLRSCSPSRGRGRAGPGTSPLESWGHLESSTTAGSPPQRRKNSKSKKKLLSQNNDRLSNEKSGAKASGKEQMTEEEEEEEEEERFLSKQTAGLRTGNAGSSTKTRGGKGDKEKKKLKKGSENETGASLKKNKKAKGSGLEGRAEFVVGKPREKRVEGKSGSASIPKKNPPDIVPNIVIESDEECLSEGGGAGGKKSQRNAGKKSRKNGEEEYAGEDGADVEYEEELCSSEGRGSHERDTSSSERGTPVCRLSDESTEGRVTSKTSVTIRVATGMERCGKTDVSDMNSVVGSSETGSSVRSARDQLQAEQAEKRRQGVDRKRREREEQKKREQEQQEREEMMRQELEEEQQCRAQEIRLKKQQQEEERRQQEEEERSRLRREQAERERQRKQQEEYRRKLQQLQRNRQQIEAEKAAEAERRQREEEQRQVEEQRLLLEMDESERQEYLRRKKEEEERRRQEMEERQRQAEDQARRGMSEARWQAELLTRQRAILEQNLRFQRGLLSEAEGLERMQDLSRPWVYSYFQLLEMLGLPATPEGVPEEA
ncbi:uncharacterized protein KIAA2012 homolog isoform X3 [Acipenser ruthenus]|uniref:uncharacterized protein KIAA2012 homolog isoform X3 n=1 Tax=Acipenser ruthenus TaxID=7906 RepID=UPI0027408650|nr:uncharacterized protein KIAA2012 homolog isoform X3 [Acipenser ruthenus]